MSALVQAIYMAVKEEFGDLHLAYRKFRDHQHTIVLSKLSDIFENHYVSTVSYNTDQLWVQINGMYKDAVVELEDPQMIQKLLKAVQNDYEEYGRAVDELTAAAKKMKDAKTLWHKLSRWKLF